MQFCETPLRGAFVIVPERMEDERGFFARTFCATEFKTRDLNPVVAQCSLSFTARRGTVRGLHYQKPPALEAKLVRCVSGAIYDVIVDLRPDSATFGNHYAIELNAGNRVALYVPEMFAHGFQTLTDGVEVLYQMSAFYSPDHSAGLRYDDPALGIQWPLPVSVISKRDLSWRVLSELRHP